MNEIYKIKKGLDIPIDGEAPRMEIGFMLKEKIAILPPDFRLFTPRLLVKEQENVIVGQPIIQNKLDENIIVTSPISGTIKEINRGEKRAIKQIVIEPDLNQKYKEFDIPNSLDRDNIIDVLLVSGLWVYIRQRPYGIIANPIDIPKAIFISAFDTSPLAPDVDFLLWGEDENFQKGIDVLKKLTSGPIHLNINPSKNRSDFFFKIKNVEHHFFEGPHPAGNVSVHISRISPLNKGDIYWYLYPQDVMFIGRLFNTGRLDLHRKIALTGSELTERGYITILPGTAINSLIADRLKQDNVRVISGNVLKGTNAGIDGYLSYYDNQITVIPEGDYYDFFGWVAPKFNKYSPSRMIFNWLVRKKDQKYVLDTNMHGEERPFVLSEQYDKYFPFDIYPVYLLKAILSQNIELMEDLGIYEVVEEDFALPEYVCVSKINLQEIMRKGIDLMIKETT
jgi:Na+-transporting NADH:ubiquinone oxidoreductase subunit A